MTHWIYFRPIEPSDKEAVKQLHEIWFPVRYADSFYEEITTGGDSSLYTCIATAVPSDIESPSQQGDDWKSNEASGKYSGPIQYKCLVECAENNKSYNIIQNKELIAGCLIGKFIHNPSEEIKALLISDPQRYTCLFYIMTLGVTNEFRNCGLATAMVEQCHQLVRNVTSCSAIYLHVITYNKPAIQFYEKLGFRRKKEIQDYYSIDGKLYNCYVYALYTYDQTLTNFGRLRFICKSLFSWADRTGRSFTLAVLGYIFSSKRKRSSP